MPFKIIQTKERNKVNLITVPSLWENDDNVLRWPKHPHKLIKDETSKPQPFWSSLPCTVKRSNIKTFEAAEKEISIMLMQSDTDEDTSFHSKNKTNVLKSLDLNRAYELNAAHNQINEPRANELKAPHNQTNEPSENFINIEDYIVRNQKHTFTTKEVYKVIEPIVRQTVDTNEDNNGICHGTPISATNIVTPVITDPDTVYNLEIVDENAGNNCNDKKMLETLNEVLINQTLILETLQSLKSVQDKLVQKVADFSVQLDDFSIQIQQPEMNVQPLAQSKNTTENAPIYIKPIQDVKALNEFERKLADPNTKKSLFETYSIICNKGKAVDCAYSYAEVMFDRSFLCTCSWSGGSRGESSKIAFKDFKNIINFFWSLVYSIDDKYTLQDNADFFKNLLKNSKKRLISKNQRASTSRLRGKRAKKNVRVANETTKVDEISTDIVATQASTDEETLDTENRNTDASMPASEEQVDNNCEESLC